jgi:hypothetical protein
MVWWKSTDVSQNTLPPSSGSKIMPGRKPAGELHGIMTQKIIFFIATDVRI